MSKYIIAPEGCKWNEREAETPKAAYCLECSWISPNTRTAVIDPETKETHIYTRENAENGNLKQVIEHYVNLS